VVRGSSAWGVAADGPYAGDAGFTALPIPSFDSDVTKVKQTLDSRRGIPGVTTDDVSAVLCDAFAQNGADSPQVRLTAFEFRTLAAAAVAELRVREKPPWTMMRHVQIFRCARVLAVLLSEEADPEPVASVLRPRMGMPPSVLEALLPSPEELPQGLTIERRDEDPARVLESLGLTSRAPSVRVARCALQPPAAVSILRAPNSSSLLPVLRNRGTVLSKEPWVVVIESADGSRRRSLEHLMAGKLGWTPRTGLYAASDPVAVEIPKIQALALHASGDLVAYGGADKIVRVFDRKAGRVVHTLTGHAGDIRALAFRPDGRQLASGGGDRTIRFWDLDSSKEILRIPCLIPPIEMVFSPSGKELVYCNNDFRARLVQLDTDREPRRLPPQTGQIVTVAYRPDGKVLAFGSIDQSIGLYDPGSGNPVGTIHAAQGKIAHIAFSPDGKRIAAAGDDRTARIWDAETGKLLHTFRGHAERVTWIEFRPDGRLVATASADRTIKIWDAATGGQIQSLSGHGAGVTSLQFSADGTKIVSGAEDQTLRFWILEIP